MRFDRRPEQTGDAPRRRAFTLDYSHGCVHVRPEDRDTLIAAGVLAAGTTFVVHEYSQSYKGPRP